MSDSIQLPDIGDSTGTLFTPEQEREFGEMFLRQVRSQATIDDDPEISDYIQTIGQKLAANSDNPRQSFNFFVVADPNINAFAGPGGQIGVNSGLILMADEESELASVLAHEIAHVTQRHLYQSLEASKRLSIPSAAAMLGAILLGTKSPQAGQAALVALQAGATQFQINFTRDNEQEADSVGMQTLSRSEFDPRAMPSFFEKLQQSNRYEGRNLPEFLRTHPVTVSRISETRARAEVFPYKQYPDTAAFQIIRTKLRAHTINDTGEATQYFKAVLKQGTEQQQDIARYGLALVQIKQNKTAEARDTLTKLVRKYPEQSHFINALAQAEIAAGRYNEALALFDQALTRFPENRSLLLEASQAQLLAGKPERTRKLLTDYLRHAKATPEINQMLAEAYTKLGNEAEGHRYMAEYYYHAGHNRAAILQLKLALQAAKGNFYLSTMIDQRLGELMEEERAKREEDRY
ncbi:putative beta-barrel assembly-enhancing protease [Methylogaea oryzae]|uniref:Putative beta-barrel assembly-enhancing protease n=2 Tax=Methylogaea oryzae TaxID=1295382 RepID=A0A8D5AGK2_9GAMM|nr:putative beta-barrel assembly-enhancing protease [Methylogaea oryzae]